jgi:hypothetical protein
MPVTYLFEARLLILVSKGDALLEEWKAAVTEAFASDGFRPGMGVVHDTREMARIPGRSEVEQRVAIVAALSTRHRVPRWAIVSTPGVQYGMGRMGEAFAQSKFRVFTDLDEAKAWASGGDGSG